MRGSDIVRLVPKINAAGSTPYVEGPIGIGKSSLAEAIKDTMGYDRVVYFECPTKEPSDAGGIPFREGLWAKYAMFDWIPKEGEKVVICIEEFDKCFPALRRALAPLINERRINDYYIPQETIVYMSGNRLEDRTGADRIERFIYNRLCRITMDFDVPEQEQWWLANEHDVETYAYLKLRPDMWHKYDDKNPSFPSPRSWAKASSVLRGGGLSRNDELEIVSGFVGPGAALERKAIVELNAEMPDPRDCLERPLKAKLPSEKKASVTYSLVVSLAYMVDAKTLGNLLTYTERLAKEYQILCLQTVFRNKPKLADTPEATRWLAKNTQVMFVGK